MLNLKSLISLFLMIMLLIIQPVYAGPVETAIQTGDARPVEAEALLDATLAEIESNQGLLFDAKVQLYNLNADGSVKSDNSSLTAISWNPSHDAALFNSLYGTNTNVLRTNSVFVTGKTIYDKEIAIIGESSSKYMVLGSNPMRKYPENPERLNEQMYLFLENSFAWLTGRNDLKTASFNVVIAHLDDSHWFRDESGMQAWLEARYSGQVTYNAENSCDDTQLEICLNANPDLLIISQKANENSDITVITQAVKSAMDNGIPVLYVHWDGGITELGGSLLSLFQVSYHWDNYWKKLGLSDFDGSQFLTSLPTDIKAIKTVLTHFKAKDYAFDWNACTGSKGDECDEIPNLKSEFLEGADAIRAMMKAMDLAKQDIFQQTGLKLQKLLILLADRYRQDVVFPMDKKTTDDTVFLKSYFADHAVYNYRQINPTQSDMGNFSRRDFSHITAIDKTINMQSRKNFRATGLYALPGQTVTITRTDNSDLTTKVFINTLRSAATHQWQDDGYKRPKYLQTPHIEIDSNETIYLTSSYGGPIQLELSANNLPVTFEFQHVGEHPFWNGVEDNELFTQKLVAGDYDWAEFVTPGFEIHSKLDKMRESIADLKWGDLETFAAATVRYTSNLPHVLAGFQGPGIDVIPEVHDFATNNGWKINTIDLVKHMNADQATCGYGCSGNPYDAYWAFSPIGHGDIHELGHGLQGGMRFIDWENHTMTNYYSYYTKSKYHQETGGDPDCQKLPFEDMFDILQASVNTDDPAAYMKTHLWDKDGWSNGAGIFIQMMMSAQANGVLENGWHLRARLHVIEREFKRAKKNETIWLEKRDKLGFSQYSFAEIEQIDNNDWLLIAISYVTQMDYRDYLQMWAIPYSAKAAAQVETLNFTSVERKYYHSEPREYCLGLDRYELSIDGVQSWDLPTDIFIFQTDKDMSLTEGGSTATFKVKLYKEPTANVIISIKTDTQSDVDNETLTFTNSDWNTAKTVTVTAIDDSIVENNHNSTISFSAASDDESYEGASFVFDDTVATNLSVSITDNDIAPIPTPTPAPTPAPTPSTTSPGTSIITTPIGGPIVEFAGDGSGSVTAKENSSGEFSCHSSGACPTQLSIGWYKFEPTADQGSEFVEWRGDNCKKGEYTTSFGGTCIAVFKKLPPPDITKSPDTPTVQDSTPAPGTKLVPKVTEPTPVITVPTTPTPPIVTEPVKQVSVNKVGFSAQAYQASENAGKVDITINRIGTAGSVRVDLVSSDDSGKASIHYGPIAQTLFWANGDDTEITVPFEIIDNSEVDGNKAVILSLGNVDNAEIQTETAVLSIVDDDTPPPEPNVPSVPVITEEPPQVESAPIEEPNDLEPDEFALPTNTVVGSGPANQCNTSDKLFGVCHAHAQTISYQAIGVDDSLSNGILDHPLTSQGMVSNTTITEKGLLKGGQVSGYTKNKGLIEDVEFVGASLSGKNAAGEVVGTLGGKITLASLVGGVVEDVRLAPNTEIVGSGKLGSHTNRDRIGGMIIGDSENPAILKRVHIKTKSRVSNVIITENVTIGEGVTFTNVEFRTKVIRKVTLTGRINGTRFKETTTKIEAVTISANSHLSNLVIGKKVIFEEGVTLDDSVTFEVHTAYMETHNITVLPKLKSLTAIDKQGKRISTWARIEGGARMGTDGNRKKRYSKKLTIKRDPHKDVDIHGNVLTDVRHIGKRADILVVAAYTSPGATLPTFYMLDKPGTPKPWDGALSSLVPFQSRTALAPVVSVPIWNNPLDIVGDVQVYFGYRLNDGLIVYPQEDVIELTLTE